MVLLSIKLRKPIQIFNFLGWRLWAVPVHGALIGEGTALFAKEGPGCRAALGSLVPEHLTSFQYKLGPLQTCREL